MGAIGSKSELCKICVVYGYNENPFSWIENESRSVYRISGLIIDCHGKQYVLTTRTKLINCKNIVMYHQYCGDKNVNILRHDMYIIFQIPEYDIVILGSKNSDSFNLNIGEIVTDDIFKIDNVTGYDILNESFIVPTKKSQYSTIITEMNLTSSKIDYKLNMYQTKFHKNVMYDQSYLPNTLMYEFTINTKNKLGIYGAVIYNKKHKLVGMVTKENNDRIFVLPTKILHKIVQDFVDNLSDKSVYTGILDLPFNYHITKKSNAKIVDNCTVQTISGLFEIKKDDFIIGIDEKDLIIEKGMGMIYDKDFDTNIPINMYAKYNLSRTKPIKLKIKRRKKIYDIDIFGTPYIDIIPISNREWYNPIQNIPFLEINGLIIAQITHELLETAMTKKIEICNELLDAYFNDIDVPINNYLVIIDCINSELIKSHNLPSIDNNTDDQKIICPIITNINEQCVSTLNDLNNIKCDNYLISCGSNLNNQFSFKV